MSINDVKAFYASVNIFASDRIRMASTNRRQFWEAIHRLNRPIQAMYIIIINPLCWCVLTLTIILGVCVY